MKFQTAIKLLYPARCIQCQTLVESDFGLCGPCWRDTPFITGLVCDCCGAPVLGEPDEQAVQCDSCRVIARPWSRGRAAMRYQENSRALIHALKYYDQHEVVRPAAKWLAQAARPILQPNMLVAPVPLHWTRLLRRRFNQSALLAKAFASEVGLAQCPDLLRREKRTPTLNDMTSDMRFSTMHQAISPHPKRRHRMAGRHVLLVDDVLTSGATMAAAADACLMGGALDVSVLALARAVKDT